MNIKKIIFFILIMTVLAASPLFSKDRVAVLDFEAKDVDESDAMAIADLFRSDLVATGSYIVLERGNMQSILDEHSLQMKGLTNDASASEIGELLAVNYLFLGNLSKFGNKFILVIDKINIETGEIEQSVKKNAVNMDNFLELSAEIASEVAGASAVTDEGADSTNYDAATLSEYIGQIGFFYFAEFKELDLNKARMQSTDIEVRRAIYDENKKENAAVNMIVNAVTFGIGGNFMQGFNELAWASVGTTALLPVAFLLTNSLGLQITSVVLYTATYVGGLISPFMYEAEYNQYMKDALLVY